MTPGLCMQVMMYNKLVGGIRLRTLRVRGDSCVIPQTAYRQTSLGFSQSLVFPETEDPDNPGVGKCFAAYSPEGRSEEIYGPCTELGRYKLRGMPNVDRWNTSCDGSGFSFTEKTGAPTVMATPAHPAPHSTTAPLRSTTAPPLRPQSAPSTPPARKHQRQLGRVQGSISSYISSYISSISISSGLYIFVRRVWVCSGRAPRRQRVHS